LQAPKSQRVCELDHTKSGPGGISLEYHQGRAPVKRAPTRAPRRRC
jgi:hypothetical protein